MSYYLYINNSTILFEMLTVAIVLHYNLQMRALCIATCSITGVLWVKAITLTKFHKVRDIFLSAKSGIAALVIEDNEYVEECFDAEGLSIALLYPSNVQLSQPLQSLLGRHHD